MVRYRDVDVEVGITVYNGKYVYINFGYMKYTHIHTYMNILVHWDLYVQGYSEASFLLHLHHST